MLWSSQAEPPANHFDLFTVALHEFGLALGLHHGNAPNSIMRPINGRLQIRFGQDDIDGIRALCRPVPEPGWVPAPCSPARQGATSWTWQSRRTRHGERVVVLLGGRDLPAESFDVQVLDAGSARALVAVRDRWRCAGSG